MPPFRAGLLKRKIQAENTKDSTAKDEEVRM